MLFCVMDVDPRHAPWRNETSAADVFFHGAADVFFAVSELKMLSFSVMLSYIWLGLVSSAALTSVINTLETARWSHKAIDGAVKAAASIKHICVYICRIC